MLSNQISFHIALEKKKKRRKNEKKKERDIFERRNLICRVLFMKSHTQILT